MRLLFCLAIVLLANTACNSSSKWTDKEKENSVHYFNSAKLAKQATKLLNEAGEKSNKMTVEVEKQLMKLHKTALEEAKLVDDALLDKAHPELREHYRNEYQKYLELELEYYKTRVDAGQASNTYQSMVFQNKWVDWHNANKKDIKFPKQND